MQTFRKFDKDGSEEVSIEDLLGAYFDHKHPLFISGEMIEEEIFDEFLSHIGDKNWDGVIAEHCFLSIMQQIQPALTMTSTSANL